MTLGKEPGFDIGRPKSSLDSVPKEHFYDGLFRVTFYPMVLSDAFLHQLDSESPKIRDELLRRFV
jgi:hypothetical protein